MAKHPTSKNRNKRAKLKKRYSKAREDAQLHGIIPTTPEGAVHPERVDPATQQEQRTDGIDRRAVTQGWSVPEDKKQLVVKRLLEPFENDQKTVDKDGNEVDATDHHLLSKNARTLLVADQKQWERDHPEQSGISKGGSSGNRVEVNVINWNGILQQVESAGEEATRIEQKVQAPLIDRRTPEQRAADEAELVRVSEEDNQNGEVEETE